MSMNSLRELMTDELKDLYSAENQLIKALPKMARKATTPSLKEAFTSHLEETRGHVERLDSIAAELGVKLSGKTCEAMKGLVEEGSEVLEEEGEPAVIDAALIGAAQRVEHYEIAAYGTVRAMAERLGYDSLVQTLQQTLDEEGAADHKLTAIAEGEVLVAALGTDEQEEPQEETERSERDENATPPGRSLRSRRSATDAGGRSSAKPRQPRSGRART